MSISDVMPAPDNKSALGRSWRVDIDAVTAAIGIRPEDNGMIAAWIVEARWAHPLWHSYYFSLAHLRPIPALGPPLLYREGATHEFLLHALDPEQPRAPQLSIERPKWLTPTNFAAQLVEPSDGAAINRIAAVIDLVLMGDLSPDTDAQRQWEALFGDAMVRKDWRAAP